MSSGVGNLGAIIGGMRRFNTPLWLGLLVSIAAFISYFTFFYRFPVTRDVPWASYILFAIGIVLLVIGWRRAPRKIVASIVAVLGIGIAVVFCGFVLIAAKLLPASHGAPALGQKAPDFTLVDSDHHPVTLSQVLAEPNTKGVLLVFYRGYW